MEKENRRRNVKNALSLRSRPDDCNHFSHSHWHILDMLVARKEGKIIHLVGVTMYPAKIHGIKKFRGQFIWKKGRTNTRR